MPERTSAAQARDVDGVAAAIQQRLPFLQNIEGALVGRRPVLAANLSAVGDSMTTPTCLQHVGDAIVDTAKADWTTVAGLDDVIRNLTKIAEFWEAIVGRHKQAKAAFAAAQGRPYCLFLRSFTRVTSPIEVLGARATMYLNDPELDANFASTLMGAADWLNPVACMHTDDMHLLIRSGPVMPAFRVRSVEWKEVVRDAIASSGSIVLYVDGASPGVQFEIDQIRSQGLASQTVVVFRGKKAPDIGSASDFAGVMPVSRFLATKKGQTGPSALSDEAAAVLQEVVAGGRTQHTPTARLLDLPGHIVDPGVAPKGTRVDPSADYLVAPSNAAAFVNYVTHLPDSFLLWNAMSQDMRLRGIQPSPNDFNRLYTSLRISFVAATCLGFTASIAATVGLLSKVTSMAKRDARENEARVARYMQILDLAQRLDALTERRQWGEKLEAFRQSIVEDPYW